MNFFRQKLIYITAWNYGLQLIEESLTVKGVVNCSQATNGKQALVRGISIEFNPGENLPMLTLDRSQFQSVLVSLIINALDAMEQGGNITISTGIGLSASDTGQKGIEVAITDTGCGIPKENLDKFFEPFFTTKEVGRGTGLGLAVSYGIVQRHGGTIRVQSEVGRGSTFTIWIPVEERSRDENTGS